MKNDIRAYNDIKKEMFYPSEQPHIFDSGFSQVNISEIFKDPNYIIMPSIKRSDTNGKKIYIYDTCLYKGTHKCNVMWDDVNLKVIFVGENYKKYKVKSPEKELTIISNMFENT